MSARFIVDPPVSTKRVDRKVYDRTKKVAAKWEVGTEPDGGTCGNVVPHYDRETKKFTFKDDSIELGWTEFNKRYAMFYDVISSPMLLYRLLCILHAPVRVPTEAYKSVWWVTLKHKETGAILQFGEWKGAAGTWTIYHDSAELPKSFAKDMLALCNELAAKDCPHPYDGCVAGCVA